MKRFYLFMLIIICQVALTYEYKITECNILADVDKNGTVREEVNLAIMNTGNTPMEQINYSIPNIISDLTLEKTSKKISRFSVSTGEWSSIITFHFDSPIKKGELVRLSMKFKARGLIGKLGENFIFRFSYTPETEIDSMRLTVLFPREMLMFGALTENAPPPFNPTPDQMYIDTDTYRSVLVWNWKNLSNTENVNAFVIFSSTKPLPTETGTPFYLYVVLGFVLLFLLGFLFTYHGRFIQLRTELDYHIGQVKDLLRRESRSYLKENEEIKLLKEELKEKESIIEELRSKIERGEPSVTLALLKGDEKIVMEEIMKKKEITQKDLQETTGFSKAKLSRLIAELEVRGLIRKKRWGKTNLIYLSDLFKRNENEDRDKE
ncbi:MAG: helix-turn-helix transcriptional regulator [Candidatus Hydrothermarchaeota archaeon]